MHEKYTAEVEKKIEQFVNEALAFNKKHNIFVRESIKEDYEKDVDRTTADGKASAVHFLHFKFNDELIEAFKDKNNTVQIGIDHEAYGHLSIVSDRAREELAKDFI